MIAEHEQEKIIKRIEKIIHLAYDIARQGGDPSILKIPVGELDMSKPRYLVLTITDTVPGLQPLYATLPKIYKSQGVNHENVS